MKHSFKDLKIWQKSRFLVAEAYKLTQIFPKEELFGLSSQIRRAAVSVSSNIAEGCGRDTEPQLAQFLDISMGSLCELETQFIIAYDLNFIKEEQLNHIINLIIELQLMMQSFKIKVRSNIKNSGKGQ